MVQKGNGTLKNENGTIFLGRREYLFYRESNGELKGKSKFTKSIKTIMIPWDGVAVPRNWKSSEGPVFSAPTVGHFQTSWLQTESKHGRFLKGWRCFITGPTGGGSVGFVYWLLPLFQLLLVPFPGRRLIKAPKKRMSKKIKLNNLYHTTLQQWLKKKKSQASIEMSMIEEPN